MSESFVASNAYTIELAAGADGNSIGAIHEGDGSPVLRTPLLYPEVTAIAEFAIARGLVKAPSASDISVSYEGAQPTLHGSAVDAVRHTIARDWGEDFAMTATGEVVHLPDLAEFLAFQEWKRAHNAEQEPPL